MVGMVVTWGIPNRLDLPMVTTCTGTPLYSAGWYSAGVLSLNLRIRHSGRYTFQLHGKDQHTLGPKMFPKL